jgi:hypothetical protein
MTTIRERVTELARERQTGVTVDTLIDVLDDERKEGDSDLGPDYEAMTVEELHGEFEATGKPLPTDGSGANGAVVKADLIEALRS